MNEKKPNSNISFRLLVFTIGILVLIFVQKIPFIFGYNGTFERFEISLSLFHSHYYLEQVIFRGIIRNDTLIPWLSFQNSETITMWIWLVLIPLILASMSFLVFLNQLNQKSRIFLQSFSVFLLILDFFVILSMVWNTRRTIFIENTAPNLFQQYGLSNAFFPGYGFEILCFLYFLYLRDYYFYMREIYQFNLLQSGLDTSNTIQSEELRKYQQKKPNIGILKLCLIWIVFASISRIQSISFGLYSIDLLNYHIYGTFDDRFLFYSQPLGFGDLFQGIYGIMPLVGLLLLFWSSFPRIRFVSIKKRLKLAIIIISSHILISSIIMIIFSFLLACQPGIFFFVESGVLYATIREYRRLFVKK